MRILDRGLIFDGAHADAHERCSFFCSLVHLADGSLRCGFGAGSTKGGHDCHPVVCASHDRGASWRRLPGRVDLAAAGPGGAGYTGLLAERRPGVLVSSICWVDRSDPERPFTNPETGGLLPVKYLLAESTDGGESWGSPWQVDLSPHPAATPTMPLIRLADGRLMLAYEHWKNWDQHEVTQRAVVRFSTDEGLTWGAPTIMASHPDQRLYYWDNRIDRDPVTGELLMLCWTHDPAAGQDVNIHLVRGSADGAVWGEPVDTGIAGQIAAPLWLGGDDLLCFYVHRHDPPGMRAILSHDRGKTWDHAGELVVHDHRGGRQAGTDGARLGDDYWNDMQRWTFGHPALAKLDDGTILAVWYAGNHEYLDIHWSRLG